MMAGENVMRVFGSTAIYLRKVAVDIAAQTLAELGRRTGPGHVSRRSTRSAMPSAARPAPGSRTPAPGLDETLTLAVGLI